MTVHFSLPAEMGLGLAAFGGLGPILMHFAGVPAPTGSEWVPWVLSVVNTFGPILIMLAIKHLRKDADDRRTDAQKKLADGDPTNDSTAMNQESVADAEDKVADLVESVGPGNLLKKAEDIVHDLPAAKKD